MTTCFLIGQGAGSSHPHGAAGQRNVFAIYLLSGRSENFSLSPTVLEEYFPVSASTGKQISVLLLNIVKNHIGACLDTISKNCLGSAYKLFWKYIQRSKIGGKIKKVSLEINTTNINVGRIFYLREVHVKQGSLLMNSVIYQSPNYDFRSKSEISSKTCILLEWTLFQVLLLSWRTIY